MAGCSLKLPTMALLPHLSQRSFCIVTFSKWETLSNPSNSPCGSEFLLSPQGSLPPCGHSYLFCSTITLLCCPPSQLPLRSSEMAQFFFALHQIFSLVIWELSHPPCIHLSRDVTWSIGHLVLLWEVSELCFIILLPTTVMPHEQSHNLGEIVSLVSGVLEEHPTSHNVYLCGHGEITKFPCALVSSSLEGTFVNSM